MSSIEKVPWWAWAILALIVLGGGGFAVYTATGGLRRNNPFNLRPGSVPWKGQVGVEQTKVGPFVVFGTFEGKQGSYWGLRAGLINYIHNQQRYSLWSIADLVNRITPPSENDSGSYANSLAKALGVSSTKPVTLAGNAPLLTKLATTVTRLENGVMPYPSDLVAQAVTAAANEA